MRTKPQTVAALAAALIVAATVPAAARADYPTAGFGLISDGVSTFSLVNPAGDAVSVYEAATGAQVGASVPLPLSAKGLPYRWTSIGLTAGRVFLKGDDPGYQRTDGLQDRLAVADAKTGAFRPICSNASDYLPAPCPPVVFEQVGSRWIFATRLLQHSNKAMIYSYVDTPSGVKIRTPSRAQARQFERRVSRATRGVRDQALDLDGDSVTLDRRWGYRRSITPTNPSATTIRASLAKRRDRRVATVTIGAETRSGVYVRFGRRGMCATTGARVVLWDAKTRRIWRRPVPILTDTVTPEIACTTTRVLTSIAYSGAPFGPAWAWPTDRDPAGWTKGPLLRPGGHRTYR